MKRLTILLFLIAFIAKGQSPSAFKYQAVMRGADGTLLMNKNIAVRVSIIQGTAESAATYVETHTATTSSIGVVNLSIGKGTKVSGINFSTIDWSGVESFIKIEMDPAGGSSFILIGTSQLLSVPYALHSNTADKATTATVADTANYALRSNTADKATTAGIADTAKFARGPWTINNFSKGLSYTQGKISLGSSNQVSPSMLFINTPIPTSDETKANGMFIQANDVISRGFPLWLRSNTSSQSFGTGENQTLGRMIRLQDQRFGFDAIWDVGIGEDKSLFIMTGDLTKRFTLTTTGNVGINNITPSHTLDVGGDVNATAFLLNGLPLVPSQWTSGSGNTFILTGNVGIGKNNPAQKLDVNGQVNASGFMVNGVPLSAGNYWNPNGSDIYYSAGKITVGTSSQLTPSMLYIDTPIPTSDANKANGMFLQANDVVSRGYPLWIRSNTSSLAFGSALGQTMGRMLRFQDQRFGFDAIWDFGIDDNMSLYIMGGNNDYTKKFSVTTSGNVGINQPFPQYRLDVNGTINATEIRLNGNVLPASLWSTTSGNTSLLTGNAGIGTTDPHAKLEVKSGDVYINNIGSGVIMKSPNGGCWRMTVDNSGAPVFSSITCP
jgi:hypothetical protein